MKGKKAVSIRIALSALIIQERLGTDNHETLQQVLEKPAIFPGLADVSASQSVPRLADDAFPQTAGTGNPRSERIDCAGRSAEAGGSPFGRSVYYRRFMSRRTKVWTILSLRFT